MRFLPVLLANSPGPAQGANLAWVVLGACLALLAAAGVWLAWEPTDQPSGWRGTMLLCITLSAVAFFAAGFAVAMGGGSGLYSGLGPLTGLTREWAPNGEWWGIAGQAGFFLSGPAYNASVYALFLFQAALVIMASVIAIIPWAARAARLVTVIFSVLFGGLLYALYANWSWGAGWLAHLGQSRALGHGFVDFAGAAVVNASAGMAALGALLAMRRRQASADGIGHTADEGRVLAGLALTSAGWIGLVAAGTYAMSDVRLSVAAANVLVALVCSASVGLLYSWFAGGQPDPHMGARAGLAGLVAISGGAPFFPAWAAALTGAVAAFLAIFGGHALGRLVHGDTSGGAVAAHGLAGIWGLLALGLMADGTYGMGWNGVGERVYLGVNGQGVTGMFPAGGVPADPSQLTAQAVGAVALIVFPVITFLVVGLLTAVLTFRPKRKRAAADQEPQTEQPLPEVAPATDSQPT